MTVYPELKIESQLCSEIMFCTKKQTTTKQNKKLSLKGFVILPHADLLWDKFCLVRLAKVSWISHFSHTLGMKYSTIDGNSTSPKSKISAWLRCVSSHYSHIITLISTILCFLLNTVTQKINFQVQQFFFYISNVTWVLTI